MTQTLKLAVLELHEQGMTAGDIAKRLKRMKRDIEAIIALHAKRPDLKLGMKGMVQLAKEAGLI